MTASQEERIVRLMEDKAAEWVGGVEITTVSPESHSGGRDVREGALAGEGRQRPIQ